MGNRAKDHGRPTVDEQGKPGRFKATTQLLNESHKKPKPGKKIPRDRQPRR